MISWFPSGNRGIKLKQSYPVQIPPETKYEVVNVLFDKSISIPPDTDWDEKQKIQSNDVNKTWKARFQPNIPQRKHDNNHKLAKCMNNLQRKFSLDIR